MTIEKCVCLTRRTSEERRALKAGVGWKGSSISCGGGSDGVTVGVS